MKPANQKAPGSNRDAEIYQAYLKNCGEKWGIPDGCPGRATPEKYFDINRTASRGGL